MSTPHHLTVPREICDEIYLLLLQSSVEPPASPRDAGPRLKSNTGRSNDFILYPASFYQLGAASKLAQCSRQLRCEIFDLSQKPSILTDTAPALDVMIQRGKVPHPTHTMRTILLWPTWTCTPRSAHEIEHLSISLRFFDMSEVRDLFWAFGGSEAPFIPLFSLLNRLLHHGPGFVSRAANGDNGLVIGLLTIRIMPGYGKRLDPSNHCLSGSVNPEACCQALLEAEWEKMYQFFDMQIKKMVARGLLFGEIRRVQVCYRDKVQEHVIEGKVTSPLELAVWKRRGLRWGANNNLTFEKIGSTP